MKKLLILALLLSTTACAQVGEFGNRDASADSVWYKSLLLSDAGNGWRIMNLPASTYVLDLFPEYPVVNDQASIYMNRYNSINNFRLGLMSTCRFGGNTRLTLSLPDEVSMFALRQDSTHGYIEYDANMNLVFRVMNPTDEIARVDENGNWGFRTTAPDSLLTVNGGVKAKNVNVTGYLQTSADTLIGTYSSSDDFDFGGYAVVKFDVGDVFSVTGFANGYDGRRVTVINLNTDIDEVEKTLTLYHQSASSTAQNRIVTTSGEDIVLQYGESVELIYDATASRWREIGRIPKHAYGGLWADTSGITVTLTSKDTFYKLKNLRHDQQPVSNVTCTDSNMTILVGGNYMITCNASFSGSASIVAYAKLYYNDVAKDWLEFERKLNATGDVGSAGFSGIAYFPAGSIIDFRIANDSDSKTVSIRHFNFSIHKIN